MTPNASTLRVDIARTYASATTCTNARSERVRASNNHSEKYETRRSFRCPHLDRTHPGVPPPCPIPVTATHPTRIPHPKPLHRPHPPPRTSGPARSYRPSHPTDRCLLPRAGMGNHTNSSILVSTTALPPHGSWNISVRLTRWSPKSKDRHPPYTTKMDSTHQTASPRSSWQRIDRFVRRDGSAVREFDHRPPTPTAHV